MAPNAFSAGAHQLPICLQSSPSSQPHQLQPLLLHLRPAHLSSIARNHQHRHQQFRSQQLPLQLGRSERLLCCAYAAGRDGSSQYASDPIDVVAKVQTEKIVVLGGSGFVGSAICKAAVKEGIEVVSLSRSGRPSYTDPWVDQVVWIAGDVFYADWDGLLNGATAVISTLGGFGTNEEMEKLNGEANVLAINAASNAGVEKFIYVSVHDYNLPDFFKNIGYFKGKKRAEAEVLARFTTSGTVLRPSFIYGRRRVNGFDIPLEVIGEPLEKILAATQSLKQPLSSLPASDVFLSSPVSVDDVALAAIKAVTDSDVFGVQTIEQIKDLASSIRGI